MQENNFEAGYFYHVPDEILEEMKQICDNTGARLENLMQVALVAFLEKNKDIIKLSE